MPINLPDGSNPSQIVLPDGTNASEVRDPNGNVVWRPPFVEGRKVYYSFNDGTADNQENPGTWDATPNNGVTFVSSGGPDGSGALEFDGTDDNLVKADTDMVNKYSTNQGPFTMSVWINADSFSYDNIYNSRGNRIAFEVDGGNARFELYDGSFTAAGDLSLSTGTYYMLTARYDDTKSPDMRFTKNDNTENGATGDFNSSIQQDIREEYIGRSYSSDHVDGEIDEFQFWDRWLTDSEIQDLYNSYV